MKLFKWDKDGGKDSPVDGLYVVEIKNLFSIVLLKFNDGMREDFHSHAFTALSWTLKGCMYEERLTSTGSTYNNFPASWKPKFTPRNLMHRVRSIGKTWVLTFRGPWNKTWQEYDPIENKFTTLSHGRKVVSETYL